MANHCRWAVSEIFDPREPTIPRAVFAHRVNEKPWEAIQTHCAKLPGKLPAFYRMLSNAKLEPLVKPLLGRGCALHEKTAHAICQFRIAEIARMAGCPEGELPDFLCHEEVNHGGRGRGRGVVRIDADGTVTEWPSVTAAAAAIGVTPKGIWERLAGWSTDPGNPTWA